MTETCDNITNVTDKQLLTTWQEADGTVYAIPNETYYNNSYLPRFTHNILSTNLAEILYQSICLENLVGDPLMNFPDNELFAYDDQMLFNIGEDKIEACLISNDTKRQELLDYLIERSEEYLVPRRKFDVSMGSFRTQMLSYDCNATYTRPWNGNEGGNVNQIWSRFLDIHEQCINGSNKTDEIDGTTAGTGSGRRLIRVNDENENLDKYDDDNEAFKTSKIVSLFIVLWSWLCL